MGIKTELPWLPELKAGWKQARLKDVILDMHSGGTPDSKVSEYYSDWEDYNNGVPWCSISDIPKGSHTLEKTARRITDAGMENKKLRKIPKGTLLYSIYASLGEVCITGIETTINQAILAIYENKEVIDQEYLYYYLLSLRDNITYFANTNIQNNLNSEIVGNLIVVFPESLSEQRRIAKELKKKDDLIESLIHEIEGKENQVQNYFNCMLLETISGKGNKVSVENSFWLKSVKKGWKVHRIKDLFELTIGGVWGDEPTGDKDVGVLRVNNFNRVTSTVDFSKEITLRNFEDKKLEERIIKKGDFLVEKSGGGELSPVGGFFLVEDTPDQAVVFSNFINLARLSKDYIEYAPFLKYVFKTMYNLGVTKIFVKQTTGIQNLDFPELTTEILALPEIEEAKEIVKELDLLTARTVHMLQLLQEKKELLKQYKNTMILKETSE